MINAYIPTYKHDFYHGNWQGLLTNIEQNKCDKLTSHSSLEALIKWISGSISTQLSAEIGVTIETMKKLILFYFAGVDHDGKVNFLTHHSLKCYVLDCFSLQRKKK